MLIESQYVLAHLHSPTNFIPIEVILWSCSEATSTTDEDFAF